MLVNSGLEASARQTPDREALVCGTRRLTYRELNDAANRVADGLRQLGVGRGDRVVVHLENSVEAVLTIFGALKAGAVFVPVNPTVKADKLLYLLNDCEASVLVSDRRALPVVTDAVSKCGALNAVVLVGECTGDIGIERHPIVWFAALASTEPPADAADRRRPIDQDLAALIYTSGSTGRGKGVMLTHANMVAAASSIQDYLRNTPNDVILDVLPLSFDYGLYQIFLAFNAGARLVLERSFAYPTALLDLMVREGVTALPIVPMIAALLLKLDLGAYELRSLRYVTNTGAALPTAHINTLRERLPHVRIFSMYGLTECKRVSYLDPAEIDARPGSVGKAMSNVEVYLVDEAGRRMDHGIGELVVRGSNVMQGYWRSPEDTARVLKPGLLPGERVLHTGDIFRIDDDGFMYFQSRTDDVIKSRGQKVSPREIENVLHAIPGVAEAAVIGVPDPVLGEAIKAFVTVTRSSPLTEQDVLRQCAQALEDFMVPKWVEIVDALPRTGSGKVARKALGRPVLP
ncbi:MAG TPA: class I adenylate-forming enzyme family protein [Vicinamibacterales bacterium]